MNFQFHSNFKKKPKVIASKTRTLFHKKIFEIISKKPKITDKNLIEIEKKS